MKIHPCLLAIAFLVGLHAAAQAAEAATTTVPVILENKDGRLVEARILGPTQKSVTLDGESKLLMFLAPGKYLCVYRFKEFEDVSTSSKDGFLYSKSPEFELVVGETSPITITAYPFEIVSPLPPLQSRTKPTTAADFNQVISRMSVAGDSSLQAELDRLRFSELDVVADIGDLYQAESDRARATVSRSVALQLNRYITQYLLPKLRQEKFTVKYLGIKPIPETFTKPTLVINYSEDEGRPFTFNYQETVYGIFINCTLELHDAELNGKLAARSSSDLAWIKWTPVWQTILRSETVEGVKANMMNPTAAFRRDALANLRYSFEDLVLKLDDWKPR